MVARLPVCKLHSINCVKMAKKKRKKKHLWMKHIFNTGAIKNLFINSNLDMKIICIYSKLLLHFKLFHCSLCTEHAAITMQMSPVWAKRRHSYFYQCDATSSFHRGAPRLHHHGPSGITHHVSWFSHVWASHVHRRPSHIQRGSGCHLAHVYWRHLVLWRSAHIAPTRRKQGQRKQQDIKQNCLIVYLLSNIIYISC